MKSTIVQSLSLRILSSCCLDFWMAEFSFTIQTMERGFLNTKDTVSYANWLHFRQLTFSLFLRQTRWFSGDPKFTIRINKTKINNKIINRYRKLSNRLEESGSISGSRRPEPTLVFFYPVLLVVGRINQFGTNLLLLRDNQNCSRVLVFSAVICCRENGYQVSSCESLKPVQDALMSPYYFCQFVLL